MWLKLWAYVPWVCVNFMTQVAVSPIGLSDTTGILVKV